MLSVHFTLVSCQVEESKRDNNQEVQMDGYRRLRKEHQKQVKEVGGLQSYALFKSLTTADGG